MYINDLAFDAALNYVRTNGTKLDICSAEPANYAGIAAVTLGNKDPVAITAPENNTVTDGRKVVVPAITDGVVDGTGTQSATHWAVSNGTSLLVASGTLTTPQDVTDGNTFTLDAIDITLRDAILEA